jgi:hypothetical protein
MTSSSEGRVNYSRRFFWLALFILLAVAGYTAAWFYAADRLTQHVEAAVAALNRDGSRASCEDADIRGYPFRIGLFCDRLLYEDAVEGVAFRAGAFRSAAQMYNPAHIIGELDGPATLAAPGLSAVELDWEGLRASIRLATPVFERLSVEAREIAARLDRNDPDARPLGSVQTGEIHARPVGDDLDLAVRFDGLALDPSILQERQMPPLDGLLDLSVDDGALLSAVEPGLRGKSGTVRTLTLSTGEATGLTVSGPFSIDDAGLIDAELQVTVRDPEGMAQIIGGLVPEVRDEIAMGFSALAATGETPTLPLTIDSSDISLGFLSLGRIPPVD